MIGTSKQEPCHDETNRSALKIIIRMKHSESALHLTDQVTEHTCSWLDEGHVAIVERFKTGHLSEKDH